MELEKIKLNSMDVSFRTNWDKPVHRWYRFHPGCSYEFPEKIISVLKIKPNERIFDPFTGSGTILVTAKERGLFSIGLDINPLCTFISRVKTFWEFDLEDFQEKMNYILKKAFLLDKITTCEYQVDIWDTINVEVKNIPKYIWRYFDPAILLKLSFLKEIINNINNERFRELFLFALVSIVVKVSKVHHVGETIVFNKKNESAVSIYILLKQKLQEIFDDVKFEQNKHLGQVRVVHGDARKLENFILGEKIDHVITHPPYPNNYNYLLRDRLPLFFLEILKTLSDEKRLRSLIVGSITKKKMGMEFDPTIEEIRKINQNIEKTGDIERSYAFLEYFDSMSKLLRFLRSILDGGYCAMLMGNCYIRGVMIPSDLIIKRIAEKTGFRAKIFRVRDRGNGAFQHIYNGKLYESVILMK